LMPAKFSYATNEKVIYETIKLIQRNSITTP
jgi:hypothetical protein